MISASVWLESKLSSTIKSIFLIWESDPTRASYFNYDKGISDAKQAISEVKYLGTPHGMAIYFTVDYDAQTEDMTAINEYIRGVRNGLSVKGTMMDKNNSRLHKLNAVF